MWSYSNWSSTLCWNTLDLLVCAQSLAPWVAWLCVRYLVWRCITSLLIWSLVASNVLAIAWLSPLWNPQKVLGPQNSLRALSLESYVHNLSPQWCLHDLWLAFGWENHEPPSCLEQHQTQELVSANVWSHICVKDLDCLAKTLKLTW